MPTEVAGVPGHGGMAVIHGMLANPVASLVAEVTDDPDTLW